MTASNAIVKTLFSLAALSLGWLAVAQQASGSGNQTAAFLAQFHAQPDIFEKFLFARKIRVGQNAAARGAIDQMLATSLSILGRPADAVALFPFGGARDSTADLPNKKTHIAEPADEYVAQQARTRRIVMVNEAHHRPQTRLLTLALLPKLRALGYTHFAAEALNADDEGLAPRGYPIQKTGFYISEPIYAEIIREALRLGYHVVPYEATHKPGATQQDRESGQAANLNARVFKRNPDAKLFVHAGYAHIDKFPGQLPDDARPMALELRRLTGMVPLSVDQTMLVHGNTADSTSPYDRLVAEFSPRFPVVLLSTEIPDAWAFRALHNMTVLLPKTPDESVRPAWLDLHGKRKAVPIEKSACLARLPCLVEARYASEGDDAVPADQFVMLEASEVNTPLYLFPGEYRLQLRGNDRTSLSTRVFTVFAGANEDQPAQESIPR